jgi:uncharacterized repeat protein (TIGR01451 family)
MKLLRLGWLAGIGAAALLITLMALVNPVEIAITVAPRASAAYAGLPTVTPLPPTPLPTTSAPTATEAPRATPPPPATTEPAPEPERRRLIPTPSATALPPPATEERAPQLAISKRADPAVAQPGGRVQFEIELTNRGDAPAYDLVVTDEVPAPLRVVDLHSTRGDIVVDGRRVTAFPRALGPGESARFTIVVEIPPDAPAGPIANTAVVTSSSPDDPGDNTSTVTIVVESLVVKQIAPPRLPTTADTTEASVLARYWPLLALALGALLFGALLRAGALRQRTLHITLGSGVSATAQPGVCGWAGDLLLDPDALHEHWEAGLSTGELVEWVAGQNPGVARQTVSLAVQRLLRAAVVREGA